MVGLMHNIIIRERGIHIYEIYKYNGNYNESRIMRWVNLRLDVIIDHEVETWADKYTEEEAEQYSYEIDAMCKQITSCGYTLMLVGESKNVKYFVAHLSRSVCREGSMGGKALLIAAYCGHK